MSDKKTDKPRFSDGANDMMDRAFKEARTPTPAETRQIERMDSGEDKGRNRE